MPLLSVQVEREDGVTFLLDVDSLKAIDTLCEQVTSLTRTHSCLST